MSKTEYPIKPPPVCDKCWKNATHAARDTSEVESKLGVVEHRYIGKTKYGCSKHKVRSVTRRGS